MNRWQLIKGKEKITGNRWTLTEFCARPHVWEAKVYFCGSLPEIIKADGKELWQLDIRSSGKHYRRGCTIKHIEIHVNTVRAEVEIKVGNPIETARHFEERMKYE